VSFFKGGDKSILEKGFNLVEYIEQMTNSTNLNIFGKYTAGLYSATIFTSILIFFIFFIYLIIHKSKSGNAIQLFIMFFALIIAIISGIVYRKITIPLVAIIGIGIILNGITSLMAGSTLVNIPTSERSQGALDISDISKEKLNQYKIISIMCIFILFALSVILFTKEFTLNLANIPNTNIYKYNNGIAILFSTVLIILSSYNIYNTNALITSIHPMQVIT
jgi:hypothetical protein